MGGVDFDCIRCSRNDHVKSSTAWILTVLFDRSCSILEARQNIFSQTFLDYRWHSSSYSWDDKEFWYPKEKMSEYIVWGVIGLEGMAFFPHQFPNQPIQTRGNVWYAVVCNDCWAETHGTEKDAHDHEDCGDTEDCLSDWTYFPKATGMIELFPCDKNLGILFSSLSILPICICKLVIDYASPIVYSSEKFAFQYAIHNGEKDKKQRQRINKESEVEKQTK